MSEKGTTKLSREEIAKQFQLPERKSKIATLLKQDDQKYCICRSSDSSRFMIACDNCEEWYHGDCIGIQESAAKCIRQYFCVQCQDEDQTLVTKFKTGVKADVESKLFSPKKRKRNERKELNDITAVSNRYKESRKSHKSGSSGGRNHACGKCTNCLRQHECGECTKCQKGRYDDCIHLKCLRTSYKHGTHRRGETSGEPGTKRKGRVSGAQGERERDKDKERESADKARQCYGLGCVNTARSKSKYCSDECGLRLAATRIFQVLPQRIQEWNMTNCVAEDLNKRELENVRKQQQEVRVVLQELEKRHKELDQVLERAKQTSIMEVVEEDADEGGWGESGEGGGELQNMYCITCGYEIHARTAIRHMERCFNKYESQASFVSRYRTRLDARQLFCDAYDARCGTFCKRLKVLCPEHCKDAKVTDDEVCGCPLVTNVFDLTGEFCRAAKKSCLRHYCWEKLRRAEIDLEMVRQWLKVDELIEQERQIRQRMTDRAGVLALMLHSTYNHEIMDEIARNAQNSLPME